MKTITNIENTRILELTFFGFPFKKYITIRTGRKISINLGKGYDASKSKIDLGLNKTKTIMIFNKNCIANICSYE